MPGTAWRSKPTWYIVAKNDRTVHLELERFVAKRMGVTTYMRHAPEAYLDEDAKAIAAHMERDQEAEVPASAAVQHSNGPEGCYEKCPQRAGCLGRV